MFLENSGWTSKYPSKDDSSLFIFKDFEVIMEGINEVDNKHKMIADMIIIFSF